MPGLEGHGEFTPTMWKTKTGHTACLKTQELANKVSVTEKRKGDDE